METKGQTTSNARGTSFELRMCMLLFVRGLIKQKNNFKLEYQVPAAQKFDDLVFHNDIDDIYFFQLKHNEKGIKKVNHTQMFNNTSKQDKNLLKGNFILLKYVKSVIDLQKSDVYKRRLKNAFVFTNMDLDVNEQDQLILGDDPKKLYFGVNSIQLTKLNLPSNHILNGSNSDQKTKFYKFCNDKNIIKILKRQADTVRKEVGNIKHKQIKKALQVIVFAVGQPSDIELIDIMKEEIKEKFKIEKVDDIYNNLEHKMKVWCDTKTGIFPEILTFETADTFFQERVKAISFGVDSPIGSFSGRMKELEKIKSNLTENHNVVVSQTTQISGLGGIGKTQLARQFIAKYGKELFYNRVIWISAENDASTGNSFRKLAEKLAIPGSREKYIENIIEEVFDYFFGLKTLFVFDNFDKDVKYVKDCLKYVRRPDEKCGLYFLFTSRNKECLSDKAEEDIAIINLDVFSDEEAENFLKQELGKIINFDLYENMQAPKQLAKTLQNFPLALQQAIAYIQKQRKRPRDNENYSVKNYIREFEIKKEELLKYPLPQGVFGEYAETTLTTFNITFDTIDKEEHGSLAISIVQLLACLYADEIDQKMFDECYEINKNEVKEFYANKMDQNLFLDDAETDDIKNKAYAAIELLEQFSLITRNELILKDNEKKTIIKIHRLVQTVIQYKYKANKQQSLENAIKLVAPEVFTAYNNFKNKNISRYKFNKSMRNLKPEAPIHLNKIENNINSKKGENRDLIEKYKIFFKYIDKFSLEKIVLKDDLVYLKKIDKSKGFWESFVKFNGTRLIQNDCINILKYLIKEEIIPINLTNKDGKTLLHIAASLGNLEIVEFLINNKAEKNANDVIGKTPLHHAIKNESEEVFSYLIKEKVDVNAKDNKGRTPLFSAIEVDNLHMFETLIKEGADANVKDNNRQTLLFEAMSYKKLENSVWNDEKKKINAGQITKLLVEKFNVDVRTRDSNQRTALHEAAIYSSLEIIKYLIDHGADVNAKENQSTALHSAAFASNYKIVKYLIDLGADVNAKDEYDRTPLHHAIFSRDLEIIEYLIDHGADVNAKDSNQRTPLHKAADNSNLKIVEFLIEHDADVNAKDSNQRTALHEAAIYSSLEIIKYLIDHGADINAKDKEGNTALHIFLNHYHSSKEKILILLMQKKPKINLKNNQGSTPLDIAKKELSAEDYNKVKKCLENINVTKNIK